MRNWFKKTAKPAPESQTWDLTDEEAESLKVIVNGNKALLHMLEDVQILAEKGIDLEREWWRKFGKDHGLDLQKIKLRTDFETKKAWVE